MKKLWGLASLVLTGTFAITLLNSPAASAATPPDSCFAFNAGTITDYYNNEANNPANPACPRDVDIPSTIGGVAVTAIGNSAFAWDYSDQAARLTTVTIPDSVTTIGDSAFSDNQLTTVTISNSVTTIAQYTFSNNQLTSVTIPDSVTSIDYGAFSDNQLTTVTIPDSVTSIDDYAFIDNQLTTVTIPDSVTSIGTEAFAYNQLTTVTIPDSVTTIGDAAFQFNQLTTVTIPESITTIADGTFSFNQLTTVTIPESITTIADGAFSNNQLTTLTIPNSVTSIGRYVFAANQLNTVTLGNSVTTIDDYAFQFNQLTTVTIPESVTSIASNAFALQNPAGRDFDYSPAAYDTIWYAQLRVAGPNALTLQDAVFVIDETTAGYDANVDGDQTDLVSEGGHLINPATTTTTFKSSTGQTLRPSQTITGKLDDGTLIPDYVVVNGPTVPGAADDPNNPTPEEQAAQRQALQAYYRLGQQQTFAAPVIAGYTGPVPASPYTTTLAAADNTVNFVYTAEADGGTQPNDPNQGNDPTQGGELADTGFNLWLVVAGIVGALVLGVVSFVYFLKKRRAY